MKNKMNNSYASLLLAAFAVVVDACVIHNSDSGICTRKYLPSSTEIADIERAKTVWEKDMPFCGRFIASYYSPCVPSNPTQEWLEPDANFPEGRLISTDSQEDVHSIRAKDKWVQDSVTSTIETLIESEKIKGSSHYHYFRNNDCEEAYSRYSCWLNFPRCSVEFNESMPMCQSSCENLFRVCGFASDLWRCEADVVDGNDDYDLKAFFPGQPFRRNEFQAKGKEPLAVCTPSIKGGGGSRALSMLSMIMVGLVFCMNA